MISSEIQNRMIPALLEEIASFYNYLRILKWVAFEFSFLIPKNSLMEGWHFKTCNLEGNKLTSRGVSLLFKSLGESLLIIREIHLNFNKIDDECMDAVGEFIKKNKHIMAINLNQNRISNKGIDILAPYFVGNTTFKSLALNGNERIGNESYKSFIKMIEGSRVLNIRLSLGNSYEMNQLTLLLAHNQLAYGSGMLDLSDK